MRWTTDAAHQARTESSARLMEKTLLPDADSDVGEKELHHKSVQHSSIRVLVSGQAGGRPKNHQLFFTGPRTAKIKS